MYATTGLTLLAGICQKTRGSFRTRPKTTIMLNIGRPVSLISGNPHISVEDVLEVYLRHAQL